jgi:hypothetical protein
MLVSIVEVFLHLGMSTDGAEVAGTTILLPSGDYEAKTSFIPEASHTYVLRFKTVATSGRAISIDNISVTLEKTVYANAMSDWISFTPTLVNGGATSLNNGKYKMMGDTICIHGSATFTGTGPGALFKITLPNGLSIDSTKINRALNSYDMLGYGFWFPVGTVVQLNPWVNSATEISFTRGGTGLSDLNGNVFATGHMIEYQLMIPITGLSSNIQITDRALEEYSYNSSLTASSDTTSFGYGCVGALIQAFAPTGTNNIEKRVRFQNQIQPTDSIFIEVYNAVGWVDINQALAGQSANDAGTQKYGVGLSIVSATDVSVYFYQSFLPSSATWSTLSGTGYRWRVRKTSGGALAGYPVSGLNILPAYQINRVVSASDTIYYGNGITLLNSGTPFTVYLQTAVGLDGKIIRFKNINTATVTVDAYSTETIDGSLTLTLDTMEAVDLMAYNSNWYIV